MTCSAGDGLWRERMTRAIVSSQFPVSENSTTGRLSFVIVLALLKLHDFSRVSESLTEN
jgi:hypothetical protein